MFNRALTSLFGSRNDRVLRQLSRTVTRINALEPEFEKLSDDALRGKTVEFKQRVVEGESLDKLLPEAFAVVREAAKRTLGMRHYDVQMIGGMVLHSGKIAEMRTGEGKTLVGTLPVYLNALADKGVHVVTVNDYLARRDAAQLGKLYNFLGLNVGVVYPGMDHADKHAAYAADITYGTNNEFGFDYLRDNMALSKEQRYQRGLHYAIVDEVDSILIDEARTPLIISGPAEDSPQLYLAVNKIVPRMIRQQEEDGAGDYWVDEKQKQVHLSEAGMQHADELLREVGVIEQDSGLYDSKNLAVVHHLNAALRANGIYQRDVDYIVRDGEVIIVDEFTGRTLPGRRWSDGLHQAVEAKEGVPIQRENQTLATVTFQNLFRMYKKLSGMTGTADTEAYEFQQIYGLEVVVIPTHKPMIRQDNADMVFLGQEVKYKAVIEDIQECNKRGQPVLVGTTSIEVSELLSDLLRQAKIPHEVLNAKQHEREAHIVAQAGAPGSVTIATNMAGRGTDIVLGGSLEAALATLPEDASAAERDQVKADWKKRHEQVLAAGGLHIVGTERHESRRIDNQLRGRSGRQGDPGSSRFYLSLEDPLLRIFAGDRVRAIMDRLKMPEGEAIEAGIVSRSIESAQRKVEARNFDVRKQLLEYDDVSNDQRKVIYQQRNELLEANDITETIGAMRGGVIADIVHQFVPAGSIEEQWDVPELEEVLRNEWQLDLAIQEMINESNSISADEILEAVEAAADEAYESKVEQVGRESFSAFERSIMLQTLDRSWREHLAALDHLRQGIHLRGYAQKNPKQEYKREAFELFAAMLDAVKLEVTRVVMNVQIQSPEQLEQAAEQLEEQGSHLENVEFRHAEFAEAAAAAPAAAEAATAAMIGDAMSHGASHAIGSDVSVDNVPKVGRNDPCPCGSGKKYKQCHGKIA